MDPSDGAYEYYRDTFNSGVTTDLTGYAQIIDMGSNYIRVRFRLYQNHDFAGASTYRMTFRFYTPRITVSSCSSVTSLWNSRYGNGYWGSNTGAWSVSCGTGTNRFYASFRFYYNTQTMNQWPYWYSGDYTDMTFNFGSVGKHVNTNPNALYTSATLIW